MSCQWCFDKDATALCGQCFKAEYCSEQCQINDWYDGGHAETCGTTRSLRKQVGAALDAMVNNEFEMAGDHDELWHVGNAIEDYLHTCDDLPLSPLVEEKARAFIEAIAIGPSLAHLPDDELVHVFEQYVDAAHDHADDLVPLIGHNVQKHAEMRSHAQDLEDLYDDLVLCQAGIPSWMREEALYHISIGKKSGLLNKFSLGDPGKSRARDIREARKAERKRKKATNKQKRKAKKAQRQAKKATNKRKRAAKKEERQRKKAQRQQKKQAKKQRREERKNRKKEKRDERKRKKEEREEKKREKRRLKDEKKRERVERKAAKKEKRRYRKDRGSSTAQSALEQEVEDAKTVYEGLQRIPGTPALEIEKARVVWKEKEAELLSMQ